MVRLSGVNQGWLTSKQPQILIDLPQFKVHRHVTATFLWVLCITLQLRVLTFMSLEILT